MWRTPEIDVELKEFARELGCDWIGEVPVDPDLNYKANNCHNNVLEHVAAYGGERVIGYYFLESDAKFWAILHSVWDNYDGLVDITPYQDRRQIVVFGKLRTQHTNYETLDQTKEKHALQNLQQTTLPILRAS
jgi:hypothetical protein